MASKEINPDYYQRLETKCQSQGHTAPFRAGGCPADYESKENMVQSQAFRWRTGLIHYNKYSNSGKGEIKFLLPSQNREWKIEN